MELPETSRIKLIHSHRTLLIPFSSFIQHFPLFCTFSLLLLLLPLSICCSYVSLVVRFVRAIKKRIVDGRDEWPEKKICACTSWSVSVFVSAINWKMRKEIKLKTKWSNKMKLNNRWCTNTYTSRHVMTTIWPASKALPKWCVWLFLFWSASLAAISEYNRNGNVQTHMYFYTNNYSFVDVAVWKPEKV